MSRARIVADLGSQDLVESDGSVSHIVELTGTEYSALTTPDATTLYVIIG